MKTNTPFEFRVSFARTVAKVIVAIAVMFAMVVFAQSANDEHGQHGHDDDGDVVSPEF
jgi:hypothetical protein